jgi:hypothetical protein
MIVKRREREVPGISMNPILAASTMVILLSRCKTIFREGGCPD